MQDDTPLVIPPDHPRFDRPVKILVLVAGTQPAINASLLRGALAVLQAAGVDVEQVGLPRPDEVPQAMALAERMQDFDGYVALGAIVGPGGAADLARDLARALTGLGMGGALNGNGIVAAETVEAASALADPAGTDAGGAAARGVLALIGLARDWAARTKGIGFRA